MNRQVCLPAFLALLVSAAFSQDTVRTSSVSTGSTGGSAGVGWSVVGGFGGPVVTGAPYSAEEVSESVQTLADGTHITHKSTVKMYRDSEGRTRTERSMAAPAANAADGPVFIDISDPVAHVHYMLNTANKTAQKQAIATRESRRALNAPPGRLAVPPPPPPSAPARETANVEVPKAAIEKLGSDTIEGLVVEGTRHTTTWPAGSMMGNDRPFSEVRETWTSTDLKIVVLSKHSDPRSGEHTTRLVNVSREEPDASLFQPPADYTVTEENGEAFRH
jgi:hypothetical protein